MWGTQAPQGSFEYCLEEMRMRAEILKKTYHLERHPEGGWFSEVYTARAMADGRPAAGSIYFLLDAGEISHFHQIDCEEIWYFHEGCGMKITVLTEDVPEEYRLGMKDGERAMVVIPEGAAFAAENLQEDGYTFVSCMTAPKFRYEGFRLLGKEEIREKYPELERLCLKMPGEEIR